jgi:hypothetical protein
MDTGEPFDEEEYGWLLVGSLLMMLIAFVGLTISEARRTKIWTSSTVTFLSAKFEQTFDIISNRFVRHQASTSPTMDTAVGDQFTEDAAVALLDVNRSRASSLDDSDESDDADEMYGPEPEPEPEPEEQVQLGLFSGAE